MSFLKRLKTAFMYPWNLLGFLAGMGFAALSGQPEVFVPLVFAGEVAYLGFLGLHPRFQQYLHAQQAQATRRESAVGAEQAAERILNLLPDNYIQRFEDLRTRCLELRRIAKELRGTDVGAQGPLDQLQLEGLDRLLWIYLRLLFTRHMLDQFFQRTNETEIRNDIRKLEERIARLGQSSDDPQRQRIRRALEDNLETSRQRLENYQKARDNSELLQLEIERLENKIRSLSEIAVNRQEPEFISHQVDEVATSMAKTERTISDLQFATGLTVEDEVPRLVQRQTAS